jgi:hypothetical protein
VSDKITRKKQVQLSDAGMNTILESHLIPADTLRADDFQTFYTLRKKALLTLIEGAMGLCTKSRSFIGFLGIKIGLSGLEKAFKMRLKRSY